MFFVNNFLVKRKCETVRCRDATASFLLTKSGGKSS
jgi:hypothetical protein